LGDSATPEQGSPGTSLSRAWRRLWLSEICDQQVRGRALQSERKGFRAVCRRHDSIVALPFQYGAQATADHGVVISNDEAGIHGVEVHLK
jgi:hypothetical protein